MPFNGSGTYTPAAAPNFPAVAGQPISSTYYNAVINDLATAMSNMITRDGQGKPSAAINWNGQNLTNIATLGGVTATFTGNVTGVTGIFANVNATGGFYITGNAVGLSFTDASGTHPSLVCQADNNIVLYSTNAAGVGRAIWNILCRNDTSLFTFSVGVNGLTAAPGDNSTLFATTAFVTAAIIAAGGAPLNSPTFTGVPTAPTAAIATATTQLATTQFVENARGARIQTVVSAATVTPTFLNDQVNITALAVACQLLNPTGTAVDGWGIVVRIKDNGTARALTYDTQYRAVGITLPTTTVISKTLYLGMVFNNADTKWDIVAVAQEA